MLYGWLNRFVAPGESPGAVALRAAVAALCAFLLSLLFGRLLIESFRRRGVVEDVSKPDSETLDRLHRPKSNTPTMGGLAILAGAIGSALLWTDLSDAYVVVALMLLAAFGALGFLDDYAKRRRRPKRGIRARTKLAAQLVLGVAVGMWLWQHTRQTPGGQSLFLPIVATRGIDLGAGLIAFAAVFIAMMSNAVNLTDGIDGLAGGCVAIVMFVLAGVAYVVGRSAPGFFGGMAVPEATGLAPLCAAVGGATLGFLWYNVHPAQVFMGDTGSLPLGALLGFVGVALQQEALLLMLGCVFMAELLSVVIQVISFQTTGRRVFLCSPLHHHFEFAGWRETKVTGRFLIVTVVAAVLGLALCRAL